MLQTLPLAIPASNNRLSLFKQHHAKISRTFPCLSLKFKNKKCYPGNPAFEKPTLNRCDPWMITINRCKKKGADEALICSMKQLRMATKKGALETNDCCGINKSGFRINFYNW